MFPELIKWLEVPFITYKPEHKVVILTDTQMDPRVWQSVMAVLYAKGITPNLLMFPRLRFANDVPPDAALDAAAASDIAIYLTTTMLAASEAWRRPRPNGQPTRRRYGKLMEESTVEILTRCGGNSTLEDLREINRTNRRIAQAEEKGKKMRITTDYGMDITTEIDGLNPADALSSRFPEGAELMLGSGPMTGTWPTGECHMEPKPNTTTGLLIWDTTAPWPSGMWKDPVKVRIEKGTVQSIEGRSEAAQVREYLKKWGDENVMRVGGEISIGTNPNCYRNGVIRSEKKRRGAMHFGVGHGAGPGRGPMVVSNLRFEGIIDSPTVVIDDNVVVTEHNQIKV